MLSSCGCSDDYHLLSSQPRREWGPVHGAEAMASMSRVRFWAMFDRRPILTWVRGRLVLTGDAAHPTPQYFGQDTCQALEDAVELGYRLGRHGDDVDVALREFERARPARARRSPYDRRPWGELWHSGDPLTIATRNRYLALRAADDYAELDWLSFPARPGVVAPGLTARVPAAPVA